jgi:hypothetical protein
VPALTFLCGTSAIYPAVIPLTLEKLGASEPLFILRPRGE